ncbi:3 beta-hydroxysteroid dehydrogenase/Delta 5--_4-isomerase type 2-like [Gigantopelta aegis]|uniref:3 beta-hydroxysteroid dehydrogenase/Delta 5-->4-isomerase type 2-like n=1 Tax=Gigantopelta aegis TaxID=1735272 RepID=UPI001B88E416|nr:3 beta-hydroxysteroid dehydrogenase/Delta 5-->4-isomerase type 2-like [Gigantopelta aegis]
MINSFFSLWSCFIFYFKMKLCCIIFSTFFWNLSPEYYNNATVFAGKKLRTASLRANVMYGEGDPYYITNGLRQAKAFGGIMMRVGNGTALFQQTYVGNTAWAFICTDLSLQSQIDVGGSFYFIPDNTPVMNTFQFMEPYLHARNFRLSKFYLPYRLVYSLVYVMEVFLKLLSPFVKINIQTASCSIKYINMTLYFNNKKAQKALGYKPIFTAKEAEANSLAYYKQVKL